MKPQARALRHIAACLLIAAAPRGGRAEQGGGDRPPAAQPDPPAPQDPAQEGTKPKEASEEIIVIGRLPRLPLPPSSVPAAAQVFELKELKRPGPQGLPEVIAGQVPGLSLSDEQGNSYQPDVSLRGFQATSVTGVPQGVSVFLDGVRVNEPTAEEINFDLLPVEDLERIEVVPGPSVLFGRNTLAGAIQLVTRRGKEGAAASAELSAGSSGLRKIRGAVSGGEGPLDFYLSGTQTAEDGWRQASGARLSKAFGKLGLRADGTDVTLSYQHVDNRISQAGPLPASQLDRDRAANFTAGDFFAPRLDQATLNFRRDLGDRFALSANGFGRLLHVEQFNVNLIAENTRLLSRTASAGGTVQLDCTAPFFGRRNLLTAGLEYAHSDVEVSVFGAQDLDTKVRDLQDAVGAYLQDTFRIARGTLREDDEWVVTAAGRWDFIRHRIADESPSAPGRENASGVPAFRRFDPLVGLNYNLSREHGVYLSLSQGFRAPALLELTCAGAAAICPGLQAGTAPDPPLKPVRAVNYEIGLRSAPAPWLSGQISAYRTDVADDIFSISPAGTVGVYFQNIGRTRRQGVEANLRLRPARWIEGSLTWALTDARFEEDVSLATARRTSDCGALSCTETVRAGSQFPLVPRHRARLGIELQPRSWLSLWLAGTFVGAQRLRGDEENVAPMLAAWLSTDGGVRLSAGQLAASIQLGNLLDARYSTFGTFAPNPRRPGAPVEQFLTPGRPLQIFASLSYALEAPAPR
ncbi:MAG TPA: TonB-dependent receptor [Gemmatimonadales bacterium]|nr:TonB-dependent receptor [Gemmatimonadales bacterium]